MVLHIYLSAALTYLLTYLGKAAGCRRRFACWLRSIRFLRNLRGGTFAVSRGSLWL